MALSISLSPIYSCTGGHEDSACNKTVLSQMNKDHLITRLTGPSSTSPPFCLSAVSHGDSRHSSLLPDFRLLLILCQSPLQALGGFSSSPGSLNINSVPQGYSLTLRFSFLTPYARALHPFPLALTSTHLLIMPKVDVLPIPPAKVV